jgi:hypothetical protein
MNGKLSWFDRVMMAVTFAEAGEQDSARSIVGTVPASAQKKAVGKKQAKDLFAQDLHPAGIKS